MSYKQTKQLEEIIDLVERLKRAQVGDNAALERGDYETIEEIAKIEGGITIRQNIINNLENILKTDY